MTIVWEDPPPLPRATIRAATRPTKWELISKLLQTRPGVWAVVERFDDPDYGANRDKARAGATARNLSHGLYNGCNDIEAVAREVDGEWRVYARYVEPVPSLSPVGAEPEES